MAVTRRIVCQSRPGLLHAIRDRDVHQAPHSRAIRQRHGGGIGLVGGGANSKLHSTQPGFFCHPRHDDWCRPEERCDVIIYSSVNAAPFRDLIAGSLVFRVRAQKWATNSALGHITLPARGRHPRRLARRRPRLPQKAQRTHSAPHLARSATRLR